MGNSRVLSGTLGYSHQRYSLSMIMNLVLFLNYIISSLYFLFLVDLCNDWSLEYGRPDEVIRKHLEFWSTPSSEDNHKKTSSTVMIAIMDSTATGADLKN